MSYKHLKLKLRVFLTDYPVAMESSEVKKVTETYSAIIRHLFDNIIVAATDKNLLYYPIKSVRAGKCWKPLPAALSGRLFASKN